MEPIDIDYQTLTDSDLNKLYARADEELMRRRNMREVPEQVVGLVCDLHKDSPG